MDDYGLGDDGWGGRTSVLRRHGCAAVVMCHASAEAEAICQKNKLSATDLLRPFTTVNAAFTITTVNDPYRLQGFHLRFVHTDELKELGSETADQQTLEIRVLASKKISAKRSRT